MVVDASTITVGVRRAALLGGAVLSSPSEDLSDDPIELRTSIEIRRRGVEMKLVLPGMAQRNDGAKPDPTLIKAVARGRAWFEELAAGRARSLRDLAEREGISRQYVRRLVHLAFLSPALVEAMLHGRQPVELTTACLTELDLTLDWTEQRTLLAI